MAGILAGLFPEATTGPLGILVSLDEDRIAPLWPLARIFLCLIEDVGQESNLHGKG